MSNSTPIDLGPTMSEEITTDASGPMYVTICREADDPITEATTDIEPARAFIVHGKPGARSIRARKRNCSAS